MIGSPRSLILGFCAAETSRKSLILVFRVQRGRRRKDVLVGRCILFLTLGAHARSVVVLCVCMCVCVYVCMYIIMYVCIHSYLPPHTLELQKKDTNGLITIQESFYNLPIFLKMLRSKVMA